MTANMYMTKYKVSLYGLIKDLLNPYPVQGGMDDLNYSSQTGSMSY